MQDLSTLPLLAAAREARFPGLVWAYEKTPGAPPQPLPADVIEEALQRKAGWVWLHVDLVDHRTHGWVGQLCALPDAARAILEGHVEDLTLGHDEGVVHGTSADFIRELDEARDRSEAIGHLCFAVTETLLVTGRRHPLSGPEDVHGTIEKTNAKTAFDLFGTIVGAFCRSAARRLAESAAVLDDVEDRIVAERRVNNERRRLMAARRLVVGLHRPVAALVALFRGDERSEWPLPESGHAALRRLGKRLTALDREIVMLGERARLLQEEVSAELQEESNRSLKALAIMSALLLPGTLVFAIFGMNTAGLPLTESPWGFIEAMAIGIAATALFYWLLLKAGADLRF